jgi:hypothetical protein
MVVDHTHGPHRAIGYGLSSQRVILPGVEVRREDRIEAFLHARPTLSSTTVGWAGLVLEDYSVPACVINRHEHLQNFVHVVLSGSVKYEVLTRGKTLEFVSTPGTTFILPRNYYQVGVEAIVPVNRASGTSICAIAQLHLYLDDIFPRGIGRPLLGAVSTPGRPPFGN